MEQYRIIRSFEQDKEKFRILKPSDVIEKLDELQISSINITDGEIICTPKIRFKELYNDEENPVVVVDSLFAKVLTINPDWYLKNQEIASQLINYVAKNNKEKEITISDKFLIDDALIEALCQNPNLDYVSLAKYSDDPYSLTKEHYLKFKNSQIKSIRTATVDEELEENFDEIIYCNDHKHLIQDSRYRDIQTFDRIEIKNKLTDQDLKNFKFLRQENILEFNISTITEMKKAIQKLQSLGLNNRIVINIESKEKFNQIIDELNIPEYEQLYIRNKKTSEEIPFGLYKINEDILQTLVSGAEDLSSFERFIYAYNITKKYKKYKENEEEKSQARNLYDILGNEYMVCVGFSRMLEDLCRKLNIPCIEYSVTVDTSYDDVKNDEISPETAQATAGGHARNFVYLKDEKYGIDGYFVSDATWDNDMDKDLYNHMLMTADEMNETRRYNWFSASNQKELFAAKSIDEFYQIINFAISRKPESLNFYLRSLITDIEVLDPLFISELKEKHQFLNERFWSKEKDELIPLVEDLSVYIVSKSNNKISGKTLIAGVKNIYENVYGYREEEIEPKLVEMVKDNYQAASKNFPIRYKITDNAKEVIMNEENKFEIENIHKTI